MMIFADFSSAWLVFLTIGFLIALILGAVVNKTGFCTMGAVSDWVNMGDTSRMRSWLMAMGVAMTGVAIFEYSGMVHIDATFPLYRAGDLAWLEHILGGLLFGVGMTLASGCGNKTLVRLGAGNFKSVIVLSIIAVVSYYMVNPFPGSDDTLYSTLFHPWTNPTAINLSTSQDIATLIAGDENSVIARLVTGLLLGLGLLYFALKSASVRQDSNHWLAGLIVGLAIFAAWLATSAIKVNTEGDLLSLSAYYTEWEIFADDEVGKPSMGAPLSPQSYTFINPLGQTLGYLFDGKAATNYLTFGIVAVFGVILGSFLWALFSRSLRFEWFSSFKDFYMHVIGAVLMAVGGVLGLGCTIGQGVSGVSTLALGSFITVSAIILSSALTMKIQYYKLVYEEAHFLDALRSAMADMRLLPNTMRALDKI